MTHEVNLSRKARIGYELAMIDSAYIQDMNDADPDFKIRTPNDTEFIKLIIYAHYTGWVLAKRGKEEYQKL